MLCQLARFRKIISPIWLCQGVCKPERTSWPLGAADCAGFQVAVHNAVLVCGFHRLGDFNPNLQGLIEWESAFLETVCQRLTFQKLHNEVIGFSL
jgi:hypothetical protein